MKFRFHLQPDSDVPASTQLLNQISFAIASRQFPPGYQLPSTRQLAMITGLHRNTINKVYSQLEELGLVEAQPGSGIYVRALSLKQRSRLAQIDQFPEANAVVQKSLDTLLEHGCTLEQARALFLAEIDWRLRCSAVVLVATPAHDLGLGELIGQQLQQALAIPVQVVAFEELERALERTQSATVITNRYHLARAETIAAPRQVRVLPVEITDFSEEIALVKALPRDSCLGLVSLSSDILNAVELFLHSLRGEEILVLTSQLEDTPRLRAIVRSAQLIIADQASRAPVEQIIQQLRADLIRPPQLFCSEQYIQPESIRTLKRELGLS
ncbi:GntR family transcriptional regulator [Gloeobacter kilaueensis]|uniref:GntR family transcriptional regulator n=1 Tax=Gloeobacter kilaueensis (strain ATCC BAA-2537 / CCAP 1431/1 / ULC 316 / JS1) TaxID=1183438 RepID=U5QD56_GLOK1|nr:GntR family transcriptional regulator [Gloeobacter kilaueensis]AGY56837.1 GntR family transcriptional regulator [Gloeobacter kilaueensis JS1]